MSGFVGRQDGVLRGTPGQRGVKPGRDHYGSHRSGLAFFFSLWGVVAKSIWFWIAFNAFIIAMLALDLGLLGRRSHVIKFREAAIRSAAWFALSLSFAVGLYFYSGSESALTFITGYLIEQSLSVDNIFVMVVIFAYFGVPAAYQHRVLFWGILGALVMRGAMIAAGSYLITQFHWVIYLFGAFLVFTGIRMARQDEAAIEPDANPVVRLVRRVFPVADRYHGQRFFVRQPVGPGGAVRLVATPLFVVLAVVETTDLIFAVDSVPAIFAVTQDPFLVFTSNVFAILGLRSLYFL